MESRPGLLEQRHVQLERQRPASAPGGQPLYRFAKDTAAGQVNGQGVGGSWYAANPQGRKATATKPSPTPPSPTEDTSGGGYSY